VDTESGRYDVHNNAANVKVHHRAGILTAGAVIELDINAVITGNIGPDAFATLRADYVEIYNGVSGTVKEAIVSLTAAELEPAPLANVEEHWGEASRGMCLQPSSYLALATNEGISQQVADTRQRATCSRTRVDDLPRDVRCFIEVDGATYGQLQIRAPLSEQSVEAIALRMIRTGLADEWAQMSERE
jgi:predicted Fe-Mo cluster-binding NifX family protein